MGVEAHLGLAADSGHLGESGDSPLPDVPMMGSRTFRQKEKQLTTWTTSDYDRLFRDLPPTEPNAPHGDDLAAIANDLHRSTGAIAAQWDDARSAVLGSKTAASAQLLGYLGRRGWLR
jgi:hypothetical protein